MDSNLFPFPFQSTCQRLTSTSHLLTFSICVLRLCCFLHELKGVKVQFYSLSECVCLILAQVQASAPGSALPDQHHSETAQLPADEGEMGMKGLKSLMQHEQELLVQVHRLQSEIGVRFPCDFPRKRVKVFFERYGQLDTKDTPDHVFQATELGRGRWQATLITPSLFNRHFVGRTQPSQPLAEDDACLVFLHDPMVLQIIQNMAPPASKVRKFVKNSLSGPWRKELLDRGFNLKLVAEEAHQELFAQFQAMGCRTALWDGNA